jgi:phosphoglycolate phosphatase
MTQFAKTQIAKTQFDQLTVVFDLDGTLVDTAPDLIAILNQLFVREGIDEIPFALARTMIGGGVKRLIERGLSAQGRDCPQAEISALYEAYLGDYAAHIADLSRPFPGLVGALDDLAARGCRLAVCTNKLEWLSRRLLDALALTGRFAAICGQDTFGVQKPDPAILLRTIAAAKGDPARAVMVGDSETDIVTAKAAGIPVIAVDFGYSETPIESLGADCVISHYDALGTAIAKLALDFKHLRQGN